VVSDGHDREIDDRVRNPGPCQSSLPLVHDAPEDAAQAHARPEHDAPAPSEVDTRNDHVVRCERRACHDMRARRGHDMRARRGNNRRNWP